MIKLKQGDDVRINCPSEKKFPSFYGAFHGMAARVIAVEPKGALGIVIIDISRRDKGEAGRWINVDMGWLSHAV